MKIEKALRVARKDRDASKIAMEEALSSVEEYKKQIEEMQTTIQESKQQCGLKEEHSALKMRYAALEKSMLEAKKILAVQSRSEKKVIQMKDSISEAQVREKKSAVEYETLNKKYNAVQRQCTEMEEVLADMTSKLEDVKNKVDTTEKELDMAQVRYDTGVEDLKQQHAKEIKRQIRAAQEEVREEERILCEAILAEKESEHQAAMKEIQEQHEHKLEASINDIQMHHENLLNAREKQVQELRAKLQKMEIATGEIDNNQSKGENDRLKSENAELVRKIERGVVMYNEATLKLRAKTAEAIVASNKGFSADIVAANKAMKKELTKSIESSISRGKQIQALEKKIGSYQLKLSKANQSTENFEESAPSMLTDEDKFQKLEAQVASCTSCAEVAGGDRQTLESKSEKELLESQVNSFKLQAQEANKTMSNMTEEISVLSAKASQVETLERDLTNVRLALANSQSRIFCLEEALQDTETALRVSSSRPSPANNSGEKPAFDSSESEIRKHVEDDALREYIRQRL